VHVSLAPVWFDPADVSGIITPFMVLHALDDATPCQGVVCVGRQPYLDFTLRQGMLFHNGEPVTSEDVKFSFERYRGASHDLAPAPTNSSRSRQASNWCSRLWASISARPRM
jgi:peptide/nickel transport system substrate-binding protein